MNKGTARAITPVGRWYFGPYRGLVLGPAYESALAELLGLPDGDMHPDVCLLLRRVAFAKDPTVGAVAVGDGRWRLANREITIDFALVLGDAEIMRLSVGEEV